MLYLVKIGLSALQIGILLSCILLGDAAITLAITTWADRIGRKRMLMVGAVLMIAGGVLFIVTHNFLLLILAGIVGVISPSGNEIGPFLSIEQAGLSELHKERDRTRIFAWYNLAGSFASALGALFGGWTLSLVQLSGHPVLFSYQVLLVGYAAGGALLLLLFVFLSGAIETPRRLPTHGIFGLHASGGIIAKLSALFALDAFAGGMVIQSIFAFWFFSKFGLSEGIVGTIFFGANVLAGVSALVAVPLSKRIGLINTMVFTHIPSNIFLILVPLMPNCGLAIAMLLARFSISQMDVPTRQSFTMAVVEPDERSAASGITAIARSLGAALSPSIAGFFLSVGALMSLPFIAAGSLKILYDLILYREFTKVVPKDQ